MSRRRVGVRRSGRIPRSGLGCGVGDQICVAVVPLLALELLVEGAVSLDLLPALVLVA